MWFLLISIGRKMLPPIGLSDQREEVVLIEPGKNLSSGGEARAVLVEECSQR